MLKLKDLENIICTSLHIYDCKTMLWHTNVDVHAELFKSLKEREVRAIRDTRCMPFIMKCHAHAEGIVISIR